MQLETKQGSYTLYSLCNLTPASIEINLNLLKVLVLNEMPHKFILRMGSDYTLSKMQYS